MTVRSRWRGHAIEHPGWIYSNTGEPVEGTQRPCGHCQRPPTANDHDACLGTLPGVANACCGHGVSENAYVQLDDGSVLRGDAASEFIQRVKT